jgi:cysteine-rich repeat protein
VPTKQDESSDVAAKCAAEGTTETGCADAFDRSGRCSWKCADGSCEPVTIGVAKGGFESADNPALYHFTDNSDGTLFDIGSHEFVRGVDYRFVDKGVDQKYPFKIGLSRTSPLPATMTSDPAAVLGDGAGTQQIQMKLAADFGDNGDHLVYFSPDHTSMTSAPLKIAAAPCGGGDGGDENCCVPTDPTADTTQEVAAECAKVGLVSEARCDAHSLCEWKCADAPPPPPPPPPTTDVTVAKGCAVRFVSPTVTHLSALVPQCGGTCAANKQQCYGQWHGTRAYSCTCPEVGTCGRDLCGNGVVDRLEQCDDGNADNADKCTNQCVWNRKHDGRASAPNLQALLPSYTESACKDVCTAKQRQRGYRKV